MSLQVLIDAYNQHRETRNCSWKIKLFRELFIMFGDFWNNLYNGTVTGDISSIIIHNFPPTA